MLIVDAVADVLDVEGELVVESPGVVRASVSRQISNPGLEVREPSRRSRAREQARRWRARRDVVVVVAMRRSW